MFGVGKVMERFKKLSYDVRVLTQFTDGEFRHDLTIRNLTQEALISVIQAIEVGCAAQGVGWEPPKGSIPK